MADNKTIVLITGANSGLGYDTVVALANSSTEQNRYHIILCSRSLEKGQNALKEIRSRLQETGKDSQDTTSVLQLDVTDTESIRHAKVSVEQEFGRLDVLVNNAGILFGALGVTDKQGSSVDNTLVELRKTFETNTFGPFAVTEIFLPLLQRSSHPRIVYVSSDLGSIKTLVEKKFLKPSMSYRMSKAALDMLAMYHAVKFDTYGIKVGVFNPGYVVTALGNPGMDLDAWRDFRRSNGGRDSMESALRLVDVIQGKRDSDLTRGILDASGEILPW